MSVIVYIAEDNTTGTGYAPRTVVADGFTTEREKVLYLIIL